MKFMLNIIHLVSKYSTHSSLLTYVNASVCKKNKGVCLASALSVKLTFFISEILWHKLNN